jgi:hypothetical protein
MKCTTLLRIFCIFAALVSSSVGLSPRIPGRRKKEPEGRYTRNIKDYEVLAPRLNQDGDFLSYSCSHFYKHDPSRRRKRSLPDDSEKVHYGLTSDGKDHHVELWPKHYFISPGMMIEERGVHASLDINNVKIRRANTTRCHYTGRARGSDYSEPGDKYGLHKNSTP